MFKKLFAFLFPKKRTKKCRTREIIKSEKKLVMAETLDNLKKVREAMGVKEVA